jgi:hypothetical protein
MITKVGSKENMFDVLVADPLLFFTPEEEDEDAFLLFLAAAFSTASTLGNCITDGVATTMLISVLQSVAFFCLFFRRPLHTTCAY